MMSVRGQNSSPYRAYGGKMWPSQKLIVKLGSRDSKKTHGSKTEDYLKRVLPNLGFVNGQDFKIDELDGTSKFD